MTEKWHPKPGDKVIRRPRIKKYHLKRALGVTGLWATAYGDVGSSIYYALGIVAVVAMGATPVALGIAGILFIFHALTYAEGTAMFPEAGGSASFARHGFNHLVGFIAGWALMFSYVITIAISSFTIPSYLGYFWPILKESAALGTLVAMIIISLLAIINILGVRESSRLNLLMALMDFFLQLALIVLGLVLLFNPQLFLERVSFYWPSTDKLIFGVAIAAIAYTGLETISQMAEETRRPQIKAPQAYVLMVITVLVIFLGISTIAFSVMTPEQMATEWAKDPIAGIAFYLPEELALRAPADPAYAILYNLLVDWLRWFLPTLVALLAATILLIATNAGLMGISRLAFSFGEHQQMPALFSRIHPRFRTPYLSIIFFSVIALLVLVQGLYAPNMFAILGGLYAFGSLLAFGLAHASIIRLRWIKPDLHRPFKLGWNISIRKRQLPVTAILGLVVTAIVWTVVLIDQPYSRWFGFAWIIGGLFIYLLFRGIGHPPPPNLTPSHRAQEHNRK